ncbi:DUF6545 domain-containing protein [Streptomyces sp. NPDC000134]|uniref:DUF6545 domain-containing protein n=1 Tax=Streptomyces sp. NPDC000134 TaxID=3364536 RepID=UPI0036B30F42
MASEASSVGFYICGALLLMVWALKIPVLLRRRHDTLLRAACLLLFAAGQLMFLIVLYLVAQAVAMMAASTLCWRWSREVGGSLRAGPRILAPAYLIIVSYDVIRLIAVAARRTGHDLGYLDDRVSVHLAAPACLLGALGFAVPLLGPRLAENASSVRQFRQLAPLWQTVRDVPTPGAVRASLPWWRTPPAILLTGRKTAIYDAILALAPYCDSKVREAAYCAALRHGEEEHRAAAAADAAVIAVAAATAVDGSSPAARRPHLPHPPTRPEQDLIPLSRALTSPVVQQLRQRPTPSQKAATYE